MASRTSSRHRMRCNACRRAERRDYGADTSARFALRKHPLAYKREPRCPTCGSTDVVSVEAIRQRELAKQEPCNCLPFPHRMGSIAGCKTWPGTGDDEADYYAIQSVLQTKRSG